MKLTAEQEAIKHEAATGKTNIMIEALAGCTKTTTLLECLKVLPQKSVLFAAFNKGIADEAQARLPPTRKGHAVIVKTFHALGRELILKHYPKLTIDKNATEDLINAACGRVYPSAPFEVRRAAMRLVRCAKESLQWPIPTRGGGWPTIELVSLGFDQGLFGAKMRDLAIERSAQVAQLAVQLSLDMTHRRAIDFCDMTWLPTALDLEPHSRFQAVMLDEVQDISDPQIALVRRFSLATTRVIAAGDVWQQIYNWRGSVGARAWEAFAPAKRLPLTMTWRCSHAVVREANTLVPELRAAPHADEGEVGACTLGELPFRISQTPDDHINTFVLSRRNSDLLDCALFLWRAGTKFTLNAGQQLLEPLFNLLDYELDLGDEAKFLTSLRAWHTREAAKADQAGATSRREQIDEQVAMLSAAVRYAAPNRLRRLLESILSAGQSGVLLSTVHKVKGLEAERVFLLKQTFARYQIRSAVVDKDGFHEEPVEQEELNIEYVAITRAKQHLIWVDIERKGSPELLEIKVEAITHADLDAAYTLAERAMEQADRTGDAVTATRLSTRAAAILKRMRS